MEYCQRPSFAAGQCAHSAPRLRHRIVSVDFSGGGLEHLLHSAGPDDVPACFADAQAKAAIHFRGRNGAGGQRLRDIYLPATVAAPESCRVSAAVTGAVS